jgi:RNA polymerase sigma-70 factor (ECF subfamily)
MPTGGWMPETDAQRAAAFQDLAERDLHASYRVANAILGNEAEAQDAVQDAIVQAWQRWDSLRDQARFEPWFRRIVVNGCRDRLRRAARRPTTDISAITPLSTPDAAVVVQQRIAVEQAFAGLKPDDVVVLALRHFVDLELEDIACLLDVPLATAKTRLHSARKRLRARIEEQATDGDPR